MIQIKNVLLFSGKAGVGKTTGANFCLDYLSKLGYNCIKSNFAKGIKDCATEYMGWDGLKDERGRKLLQDLGTYVGRQYDPYVWPKYLFERYLPKQDNYPFTFVLVDDWRFYNEINYCRKYTDKTFTIRIESPRRELLKGTKEYYHQSEIELPSAPSDLYDYEINNEGTMGEFETNLMYVLNSILEKEK